MLSRRLSSTGSVHTINPFRMLNVASLLWHIAATVPKITVLGVEVSGVEPTALVRHLSWELV